MSNLDRETFFAMPMSVWEGMVKTSELGADAEDRIRVAFMNRVKNGAIVEIEEIAGYAPSDQLAPAFNAGGRIHFNANELIGLVAEITHRVTNPKGGSAQYGARNFILEKLNVLRVACKLGEIPMFKIGEVSKDESR
jgi:hypothetical protein